MHDDEIEIDEELVRRLVTSQLPAWSDRQLRKVEPWGTDNAIWCLGADLVLRLPRVNWAVDQVEHEAKWLPFLAPHLPVAIPTPVAIGEPGFSYPYPWSVHKWLPGTGASIGQILDPVRFALDLATVLTALEAVPTDGAPLAYNRALPLQDYVDSARAAIASARDLIDVEHATEIWEDAIDELGAHTEPSKPTTAAAIARRGTLIGRTLCRACLPPMGCSRGLARYGISAV